MVLSKYMFIQAGEKVIFLYVGIMHNKWNYRSIDALHYVIFKKENPQLCIYTSADLNVIGKR